MPPSRDVGCFACQAFADKLEERVVMSRQLSEATISDLVTSTCAVLVVSIVYSILSRASDGSDNWCNLQKSPEFA